MPEELFCKIGSIYDAYRNYNCENDFEYLDGMDSAIIGYHLDENGNFSIVYAEDYIIEVIMSKYRVDYDDAYDIYCKDTSKWHKGECTPFIVINRIV